MSILDIEVMHNGKEEKPYKKLISFNVDDVEINILKNNSENLPNRNLELITDYAFVLKEIVNDTKLNDCSMIDSNDIKLDKGNKYE